MAVSGCGGDEQPAADGDGDGPEAGHVHGLGVNPADGALMIATHAGLFRAAPGSGEPSRVGQGYQDTMGFTVVGGDHFLGSGHPDPRAGGPPHLGLIESRDAGQTWRSVSLSGEADLHVLEAEGGAVYGYDASGGRFLASRDGGRTWSQRGAPEPFGSLAIDPEDSDTLVASGQDSLYISRNGGRRWSDLADESGYLAWPAPNRLYLLALDGTVRASANDGRRWRSVGAVGGQPAAFEAGSPKAMYVALHDGTIEGSEDGGRLWRVRARP